MPKLATGQTKRKYLSVPEPVWAGMVKAARPGETLSGWILRHLECERQMADLRSLVEAQKKLLERGG